MISTGIIWVKSFAGSALVLIANLSMGLIAKGYPTQFPVKLVKPQAQFLAIAKQHKSAWQKNFNIKNCFHI